MYSHGQIVWDIHKKFPTIAYHNIYDVTTHFIYTKEPTKIALPDNILDALDKLEKKIISPAPFPITHCKKCGNWKTNHNQKRQCIKLLYRKYD